MGSQTIALFKLKAVAIKRSFISTLFEILVPKVSFFVGFEGKFVKKHKKRVFSKKKKKQQMLTIFGI